MNRTKIEWSEVSWNPITGCTPVSAGCDLCYARRMAHRLRGRYGYPADEPFRVTLHHDRLGQPLGWKKPRMIFVCSMGDLFHEDVPFEFVAAIYAVIMHTPWHRYQILTKRPERMCSWLAWLIGQGTRSHYLDARQLAIAELSNTIAPVPEKIVKKANEWYLGHCDQGDRGRCDLSIPWPQPNLWLGTTIENADHLDRLDHLMRCPAAVRYVSMEPLLGSILLPETVMDPKGLCGEVAQYAWEDGHQLNWVIAGGETGPGARPMHPDWVRSLRGQCQAGGVSFFFKSWGQWFPDEQLAAERRRRPGSTMLPWDVADSARLTIEGSTYYRVGKKLAGRLLDGVEHNAMPEGRV